MTKTIISLINHNLLSIKAQLIMGLGVMFIITLAIALIGYVSLRTLQEAVEQTLQEAGEIRDLSLQIQNDFLEARQGEANFLNSWKGVGYHAATIQHATTNAKALAEARQHLVEMQLLLQQSEDSQLRRILTHTQTLLPLLDDYEAAFLATVEEISARSRAGGVDRNLRRQLDQMTVALVGTDLYPLVLELRADELAYFNTHHQVYLDLVAQHQLDLSAALAASTDDAETRTALLDLLQTHQQTFEQLVEIERQVEQYTSTFSRTTQDIDELIYQLRLIGADARSRAQMRLDMISHRSTQALMIGAMTALVLAAFIVTLLVRHIVLPLNQITQAAERFGQGDLSQRVEVQGPDELARLAVVFNHMAMQLAELVNSLEQSVMARTQRLETLAALSGQLNALNQQELLNTTVSQIKKNLGYYHASIYLVDEAMQQVSLTVSAGEGAELVLAEGFVVSTMATNSLIAKSARTKKIVWVNDVYESEDWLSHAATPNTRSEMSVPILWEGAVIGVLDVQQDTPNSLDVGDVGLLRSLANQLAIAMHNARLYSDLKQVHYDLKERAKMLEEQQQALEHQTIELAGAKTDAETAHRAKSEFLASMSHELRTPLNGILGYAQIMGQDEGLTPKQRSQLEIMQRSGEHLLTLLNDVLALSRLETHKVEFVPSELYLPMFLEKLVDIFRIQGEGKGLQVRYEPDIDLPSRVWSDEQRLRHLLINLLGNAVKFTEKGEVVFRVMMLPANKTQVKYSQMREKFRTIRFEVQDTGIGIPTDQLERIFLPFEQIGGGREQAEGVGLGLTISQRFAHMMGGELNVRSRFGEGSVFWVDLEMPVVFIEEPPLIKPKKSSEIAAKPEEITAFPPMDELLQLLDLIMMGDILGVEEYARNLRQTDEILAPFAEKLELLAQAFAEEELLTFIKQYVHTEEPV